MQRQASQGAPQQLQLSSAVDEGCLTPRAPHQLQANREPVLVQANWDADGWVPQQVGGGGKAHDLAQLWQVALSQVSSKPSTHRRCRDCCRGCNDDVHGLKHTAEEHLRPGTDLLALHDVRSCELARRTLRHTDVKAKLVPEQDAPHEAAVKVVHL
eukprot:CAMPEP_0117673960 /NCGR_PEP_ID=MMETSP0804-20121206/14770_1 /TAXON_ID=1074897 /ORGANISM="Tetraselmis astigmatica, Strain CCMP880" /LENGTH=155 /DNA_ID=CAMNT_0005482771 /DNA_START=186 /DNA_END=654 /DNA_ORIENTATION=-